MLQYREQIDQVIARYFQSISITEGELKGRPYIRYAGRFYDPDSAKIHSELMEQLKPFHALPIFRMEENQPVIFLAETPPEPKPTRPWKNLVFFILTLISVLLTGALYSITTEDVGGENLYLYLLRNLWKGWPFALSLLAILAAHEFGHYLAGRFHKTHVTLPFFIPFPFSAFGTMGAFIQMKEVPRNRNHLLDIGIAGPLAGLVVAIPVLILGLSLSNVEPLPAVLNQGVQYQMEGNSILYLFLKFLVKGQMLPAPASYGGIHPILYWIQYFFTGKPVPLGGMDVMLHPVAWAGWAGLLVTALNLIPAGQLDGGHIFYVLLGEKKMKRLLPVIVISLAAFGIFWNGWWIWALLIIWLGRINAEPLDLITPLDEKRKWLARLMVVVLLLVFIPVPLSIIGM